MERDKDELLNSYAKVASEVRDSLSSEERDRLYTMLRVADEGDREPEPEPGGERGFGGGVWTIGDATKIAA